MSREFYWGLAIIAGWAIWAVLLVWVCFKEAELRTRKECYELRIRAENAELYVKKLEATLNSLCEAIEGLKVHGKGL